MGPLQDFFPGPFGRSSPPLSEKFGPSDIADHLKSVDIPAVSVFECKLWRKPGSDGEGFKAFRLCIERGIRGQKASWFARGNSRLQHLEQNYHPVKHLLLTPR